jgi:hypothetical protein
VKASAILRDFGGRADQTRADQPSSKGDALALPSCCGAIDAEIVPYDDGDDDGDDDDEEE